MQQSNPVYDKTHVLLLVQRHLLVPVEEVIPLGLDSFQQILKTRKQGQKGFQSISKQNIRRTKFLE